MQVVFLLGLWFPHDCSIHGKTRLIAKSTVVLSALYYFFLNFIAAWHVETINANYAKMFKTAQYLKIHKRVVHEKESNNHIMFLHIPKDQTTGI